MVSRNEHDFIRSALAKGIRVDGRTPLDIRNLSVTFSEQRGQVEVMVGKTRVAAVVTAELVEPYSDRPVEGFLNFYVDFVVSDAGGDFHRSSEKALHLALSLERGLKESRALDTEALCILAGKSVWSVRCDLHVLDNCGNVRDCAHLAAVLALLHFRRPDVTVVGDELTVHAPEERQTVPLALHHIPICVSFAHFAALNGDESTLVVDPLLKEEACCDGLLSLTVNAHDEVCCVDKTGGQPIAQHMLLSAAHIAQAKCKKLSARVNEELLRAEKPKEQKVATAPIDVFGVNVTKSKSMLPVAANGEEEEKENSPMAD